MLTISMALVILSGCTASIHGGKMKPGESLETWKKGAIASWTSDPEKNTFLQRGPYANKWVGCKNGYELTDYEIGFCQGFYRNHAAFRLNVDRMQADPVFMENRATEFQLINIPTSDKWAAKLCGDGISASINYGAFDPSVETLLPNALTLPAATSTSTWVSGCEDGVKFENSLRNIFEKSDFGIKKLALYKKSLNQAQSSSNTTPPSEGTTPYSKDFIQALVKGNSTGNRLYDKCSNDAKMLIENGTDPNSNQYAQLGNSLMINIPAGSKKKLCGTAYVDVKDIYNELQYSNVLAAAQFIHERI